jgi:TetR/AcrR family transcriptional repressor of nem operon
MRYPTEHKQQTHERIVRAASRRFRSRGSERAGIDALVKDLRLPHGGFYRHFATKEDLFAEAFERALKDGATSVEHAIRDAPQGREPEALITAYLSLEHCDDIAGGCPGGAGARDSASAEKVQGTNASGDTRLRQTIAAIRAGP